MCDNSTDNIEVSKSSTIESLDSKSSTIEFSESKSLKNKSKSSKSSSKESKPLKITKAMDHLISITVKESEEKKEKNKSLKEPKEPKKTKKELTQEAKALLNNCKGKTKDNKECTRKESENCDGFCKQHFIIQKEKADTVELIEKLKP